MNASYYKYRAHAGNVSGGRLVSPLPVLVVVNIKENKRMKGKLAALIYTSFSLSLTFQSMPDGNKWPLSSRHHHSSSGSLIRLTPTSPWAQLMLPALYKRGENSQYERRYTFHAGRYRFHHNHHRVMVRGEDDWSLRRGVIFIGSVIT